MYELVKIRKDAGIETVNARELHEFLGVGRDFTNWIKQRIDKYGFVSGEDYITTLAKTGERRNVVMTDYYISIDMAKELSMVENNSKGMEARKYFIQMEKLAKSTWLYPSEKTIREKLVLLMAYSKHPFKQEQWAKNDAGKDVRFDLVSSNSRAVLMVELKKSDITLKDMDDKFFTAGYYSAVKNYSGKRLIKVYFVGKRVESGCIEKAKALSKDGLIVRCFTIDAFRNGIRTKIESDNPGFEWFYNQEIDGQLVLEAG